MLLNFLVNVFDFQPILTLQITVAFLGQNWKLYSIQIYAIDIKETKAQVVSQNSV
jgi:hypothetical protein